MRLATWVASASFAASAGLSVRAALVSPYASLRMLDGPAEIAMTLAGPSNTAESLSAIAASLWRIFVSVGRLLALGLVVVRGADALTRYCPEPLVMAYLFCAVVLGASALYHLEEGPNREKPAEETLFHRVSNGQAMGLHKQFKSLSHSNTPAGRYVLAPAAEPHVLYAIAVAAFDEAESEAAIDDGAKRATRAGTLKRSALGVGWAFALCLAMLGMLAGIMRPNRPRMQWSVARQRSNCERRDA